MKRLGLIAILAALAVACGGGDKKGKSGSTATGKKGMASQQGTEHDGIVCDDSTEGEGLCADESTILFCSDGEWWLLDCGSFDMVCDEVDDIVDCFEE